MIYENGCIAPHRSATQGYQGIPVDYRVQLPWPSQALYKDRQATAERQETANAHSWPCSMSSKFNTSKQISKERPSRMQSRSSPSVTSVDGSRTDTPRPSSYCIPTNAKNIPMPAVIDSAIERGTYVMSFARAPVTDNNMKIQPSTNTAASAV